jgi:hypothetical protein
MLAPFHDGVKENWPGAAASRCEPEKAFGDLALLASEICGTPMALISLVDNPAARALRRPRRAG